jgi:hypothetical protein
LKDNKKSDIKKTQATWINFSLRSRDSGNLTQKKTKENNKVYFLKRTTSKDVTGKENDVNPY